MEILTNKTDVNVLDVEIKLRKFQETWFLLRSDVHHDNPQCRHDLELKHLKEAKEKNARIIDAGDLFCAMQGKYDKRSNKSSLRPEHQNGSYLDALVETAADFYEPYANLFLNLGYGNHEISILEKHETDLTQRLASVLNDRAKSNIQTLGYTGWIKFRFNVAGRSITKILWYTHGYGGGGPVSQDMIQSARQRDYIENADIMLSGHVHRSWVQEFIRHKLRKDGTVERREGFYIKTPTYKDAYAKGARGFEVRKGLGPRPLGAYWLVFRPTRYKRTRMIMDIKVIKAN
jgi:hypothetical protein